MNELRPLERRGTGAKFEIQRVERLLPCRVDEHPVDVGERVVPRGSGGSPCGGKLLTSLEDLLHQYVAPTGRGGERVEVTARVDEAVRMVDAHAIREAFRDPPGDLPVRLIEDPRDLDADARERTYGEESAVVQLGVGSAPVHQFVVLPGMHLGCARVVIGGARCDRKSVVVVAQFSVDDRELVQLARLVWGPS